MAQGSNSLPAVLFVCLGNICRSPMAEGAFRAAAVKAGLEAQVDSVGTASYHIGEPPDPRAIRIARENGVDIGGLLGRQIARDDFYRATHIFALDKANLQGIRAHAPRDGTAQVALLNDAVEGLTGRGIDDPYYGDEADFRRVWEEINIAVDVLVRRFLEEGLSARFDRKD
ncbi:low molecular weight protein-tyrosine-phosphatase [Erythrobacter sp.]|uniref:low molecular weight protein-tyrosine-phosphatase n=1 Tax=Erythrobacter sp. TaxID=1042 RepID=UPI001425EB27|nr:low molecular weight protein-tyrosine-phosphatase [Erythrobacter sp.]QIQ86042.1 MAG: low molecular weight phosphotyrosine protein phosphatase [Erythrobacter sp.]